MKMKQFIVILMTTISIISNNTFCMELQTTIYFPENVQTVTLGLPRNLVAFTTPTQVHINSFNNKTFPYKIFDEKASLISFNNSPTFGFNNSFTHLAVVTDDNNLKIIHFMMNNATLFLKTIDEKYTALQCITGTECLVGSDKGNLWRIRAEDEQPQLLKHYNIDVAEYNNKYNGKYTNVIASDKEKHTYAGIIINKWDHPAMTIGDIENDEKGWYDSGMLLPADVCFNKDGSLVVFSLGKNVLIYVVAILEKSKKVLRENKNRYNDIIKKELEGMQQATLKYDNIVEKIVFHDDNKHIFVGLNDGKVYCSEIKSKGQSTEVIDFNDHIKALAFSNMRLAVASLKKASLYIFPQLSK